MIGIHARFKPLNESSAQTQVSSKNTGYRVPAIGMDIENQYKSTDVIEDELGANTVLLYKDMNDLVYKVHDDVSCANKKIEQELAEKMLSKERYHQELSMINDDEKEYEEEMPLVQTAKQEYMLSHKMSVSLARDAPQISQFGVQSNTAKSPSPYGGTLSKYHRMSSGNDSEEEHSRTFKSSHHRNLSISTFASKVKSFDSGKYPESQQQAMGAEDIWLKKVMTDLKVGDDFSYDYSDSHKL